MCNFGRGWPAYFGLRRDGAWRTRSDPVRGRRRALREEIGYWTEWLSTGGGEYAEEYGYRFDPTAEVADPALREVPATTTQRHASILDLGSGPSSTVGKPFPGESLALVGVDPLADSYNRLLDELGVVPPVCTERLDGEQLVFPGPFGLAPDQQSDARCAASPTIQPPSSKWPQTPPPARG